MVCTPLVIPAIIAENQEELTDRVNAVKAHASVLQLDVMDGVFVPTESINFDFELPENDCLLEAHLMVADPAAWIDAYGDRVDVILFHWEAEPHDPSSIITLIKDKEKKAGVVINPETPVAAIAPLIKDLDEVLVMTVNPGFYGSPFLPEVVPKIKELRELAPTLDIEVDGGVTPDTIGAVATAGANMFVSGSYIIKADDPKASIETLYATLTEDSDA